MGTTAVRRNQGNLPGEITSFVGRRHEVAELKRLLAESRLVTLTGVGGVGKTRLALRVATQVRRAFPDGVWLVELGQLDNPGLLPYTVLDTLGTGAHLSSPSAESALTELLRDQQLLLVLDNCEHLVQDCALLAGSMLRAAPDLRVLATSREPLGVTGEQVYPVPPLSVADAAEPADTNSGALTLFGERAAASVPGFAITPENRSAIESICRKLEGLPLAIELAAARLRMLAPDELLDRLDDQLRLLTAGNRAAPARHRTLRAAVDWSFQLCSPAEQLLWARSSVFAASFDLRATEAVCSGDGVEREDVLEVLAGLIDKSVVIHQKQAGRAARYRLPDALRQYGLQQLREAGAELTVRQRHRDWYLAQAENAEAAWFGPGQAETFERMRLQRPELRAAMEFCLNTPGETRAGVYLAAALWFYWTPRESLSEGRHWLDRALALETEPSHERNKALWVNARLAILQGDIDAAMPMLEQCRGQARQLGDESALAHELHVTGHAALVSGDLAVASVLLEEALARFQALGELSAVTISSRVHLALTHSFQGNYDRAIALCQQSRALCEEHHEQWSLSSVLYALAHAEWRQGNVGEAAGHARHSLRLKRQFDDIVGIAGAIELLAWIAAAGGETERAAELFGAAHEVWPSVGSLPLFGFPHLMTAHDESIEKTRQALGNDGFDTALRRGSDTGLEATVHFELGETTPPAATLQTQEEATAAARLTNREKQVADLVASGLSNKEIAARLVISQRTAEAHVENILTKLGFTSRAQIAALIGEKRTETTT